MNNNCKNENKEAILNARKIALMLIPAFVMFSSGLFMLLCTAFLSGREKETHEEVYPSFSSLLAEESASGESTEYEDVLLVEGKHYIIKENEEGYIAVYLSSGEIYRTLNVPVFTLPESDRKLLKVGIHVRSDIELSTYIEGFSG